MPNQTSERMHLHIGLSVIFLLLALSGWGAFAYVAQSNRTADAAVREQIERLSSDRVQLSAEIDQLRKALQRQQEVEREMTETRGQLAAARSEIADLTRARDQAQAELATARDEAAALTTQLNEANERVSRTGAISRRTGRPNRSRR
jgi:septal ring factor EnvC (AmiA/AmiB activator)